LPKVDFWNYGDTRANVKGEMILRYRVQQAEEERNP